MIRVSGVEQPEINAAQMAMEARARILEVFTAIMGVLIVGMD